MRGRLIISALDADEIYSACVVVVWFGVLCVLSGALLSDEEDLQAGLGLKGDARVLGPDLRLKPVGVSMNARGLAGRPASRG